MIGFHEKRKLKKVLYSKTVLVLLCVPVVLMLYAAYSAYEKKVETSERRAELSAQLATLEERAGKLEHDIEMLQDDRGIETELRNRYEVGKEGEEVIVFVEEESTSTNQETAVRSEAPGLWKRLFSKIF